MLEKFGKICNTIIAASTAIVFGGAAIITAIWTETEIDKRNERKRVIKDVDNLSEEG